MTNGESTDAEVTASLQRLREFSGPTRLDGFRSSGAWRLRWCGVSPETRDNTDAETIIRTESWSRYVKVVRMALRAREPVKLPIPTFAPSKAAGRQSRSAVRALAGRVAR